jgi:glyoxalase family protein
MVPHGIHHLTAISARIRENRRFYTGPLGMRLVKRSVNQDDVRAYHLFYADAVGSPGSDLTFFDWPARPERRGSRSITRTNLRVPGRSLDWWSARLREAGVSPGPITERAGRPSVDFDDPEGQRLSLVADEGDAGHPWDQSPVPAEHQVRGLGPIELTVPALEPTDAMLRAIGMQQVSDGEEAGSGGRSVHRYGMGAGGAGAELHIVVDPELAPSRLGAGGVHHVAFRIHDAEYDAWAEHLNSLGIPNSGKVDRFWFRSLYFREPNGVLFELATDGPGFGVDEDMATLGETLVLPPFLEHRRDDIVANLKPID